MAWRRISEPWMSAATDFPVLEAESDRRSTHPSFGSTTAARSEIFWVGQQGLNKFYEYVFVQSHQSFIYLSHIEAIPAPLNDISDIDFRPQYPCIHELRTQLIYTLVALVTSISIYTHQCVGSYEITIPIWRIFGGTRYLKFTYSA